MPHFLEKRLLHSVQQATADTVTSEALTSSCFARYFNGIVPSCFYKKSIGRSDLSSLRMRISPCGSATGVREPSVKITPQSWWINLDNSPERIDEVVQFTGPTMGS